ncbi:MAG: GFA family protein [Holophagales bacterium]|nr:GFA family protein [Holophagales bacterium]MYG29410.1 GFA family protein [Holophagales bacterium]MYI80072.1 GFA family protein [Holophagales bacterium]
MLTGTCLCEDVAFEVDGDLLEIAHCHCSVCRKFHGSAYATFGAVDPKFFRWTRGQDKIVHYQSSEHGFRHFCPRCGSAAPANPEGGPVALVTMGSVTEDPGIRPTLHIFAGSKAPWHTIVDDLPQHDEYPPDWGAPPGIEKPVREPATRGATLGSCLCGVVTYEFDGPPDRMVNCHCSRCRRQTSAAYGTFVFVAEDAFSWLTGSESVVGYKMPEADVKGTAFCRHCGSLVPRLRDPGGMQIPAGSLDGDPEVKPAVNIFVGSRAPWSALDESIPCFTEYPE